MPKLLTLQTVVCQLEHECHLLDHELADVDEVASLDEHGVPLWVEIVKKNEDEEEEDEEGEEIKEKEKEKNKLVCLATPWPHRVVRVVGDSLKFRSRWEGAGEVSQLLGKGRG